MRYFSLRNLFIILISFFSYSESFAQKNIESQISDSLTKIANSLTYVGKVPVLDLIVKPTKIIVVASDKLSFIPFRPDNVKRIYSAIAKIVSIKYPGTTIVCITDKKNIEDLIPLYYKTDLSYQKEDNKLGSVNRQPVTNISRPYSIKSGLQNKNIALWQSHGWYYDLKKARWSWQRARVFQVVEDLYTQSFILPFIVPMLENAGANTFLPRERDTQLNELVVDNDIKSFNYKYREHNNRKPWKDGDEVGFANSKNQYLQGENPFTMGGYRMAECINDSDEISSVEWFPTIPEDGFYAVYVSYKTQKNSTKEAHYTVYHRGGKTEYKVNQTMCGSTWVYLGHFYFEHGRSNAAKVVLTNFSPEQNTLVTADAVKFGGGMGNIARNPNAGINEQVTDSTALTPKPTYPPETSGYPRFAEAARYWLQWAGIPDSIYSKNKGKNDYTDDLQSRGNWVNYLAGGSSVLPNTKGLNVPIDLAFAFHTDAGTTSNDSIIGTLGICSVAGADGKWEFKNGESRWTSRELTDIVQTEIVSDIRANFAPEWTRRSIWNKSYAESRIPEVPSMLLELLSHQNFADMRYGLDPRFRFTVSRSIYKGILKFLSAANNQKYIVQPLPIEQFSCKFIAKNKLELRWKAVTDKLEPTAVANKFVVYTRINDNGFDNGTVVNSNKHIITIQEGKIYSFKVCALNDGGQSFPSEILSAYRAHNEKQQVLIVNGFDRLSAPASFKVDSTLAGFMNTTDAGVPYIEDISFVGSQYEFKRSKPWKDDDDPGFGASYANYETKVIAGNSFDYPFLHGKAISEAGYSYVSSSLKSVLMGEVDLNQYKIVDLILGKQKQTYIGNAKKSSEFKTFPLALQQSIQNYCSKGGSLLVSGAYIGSDLCDGLIKMPKDRLFLESTLKFKYRTDKASVSGKVKIVNSPFNHFKKIDFDYFDTPNAKSYYVESPDAIEPAELGAYTICRYSENNASAAVAYAGKYKTCAFGFPLETIIDEKDRNNIIASALAFLNPITSSNLKKK